jgi:hypothetical protein
MTSAVHGLFDRPTSRREDFVSIPDVRAISNGLSLICALNDGRRFGVPADCIWEQSEVRRPGDHGILTVLRWFADLHQLSPAA